MKTVKNLCRVLCMLAVSVSFTNCQNDAVSEIQQEESIQQEHPFKTSLLAKQDIETNSKLYNQMRSLTAIQSNSIAKSAYNGVYDFTIDTDVVKFIESTNSNSHSYTLPIERTQPTNELENLVFTYNASVDDYTSSIVTYHFTAAQKQEFLVNGYTTTDYSVSHQPIYINIDDVVSKTAMPIPCSTSYTVYHITPDTGETFYYGTNGVVHNACQHEEEQDTCETFTVIEIDCPDGGSVAGATHSTSGNNTGTSTGSNNHSNAGGSSSSSGDGNTTQQNNTDDIANVVTSPISRQDKERLTTELNSIVINDDTWEFSDVPLTGAPEFDSVEDFEAHINSINNIEGQVSTLNTDNPDIKIAVFSTSISYIADLDVKVYQQMGDFFAQIDYAIQGIESNTSGFDLLWHWEPDDNFGFEMLQPYGEARTTQYGILKYGAVIEGYGIYYKRKYTIRMYTNSLTGEALRSFFFYN